MTKYKLQTLLKQQTVNRHISCRICPKELQLCKDRFDGISDVREEILFKTDNLGRWTFLNSIWSELTGFTVPESIGNSFLNYVHPCEYQRNLELFQILKAQQIEESAYKTRYKTKSGDVCVVKIHTKLLIDNQGEMIGTFGKLKLIDFESQPESNKKEQHQINNQYDGEVILGNHRKYLEALVSLENTLQTFDDSDESYKEILSILGLAYQASRVYIFENHYSKNGDLLISQKAEWFNTTIASEFEPKNYQNKPITEFFPGLQKILRLGNAVWGTIGEFGFEENKFLEARGVVSVVFLPIIIKGEFFGFIGLDDCVVNRVWQPTEIAFLQAKVGVISLAFQHLLNENNLSNTIKEYQKFNLQLEEKIHLYTLEIQKEIGKRQRIEKKLEEAVSLQKTTLETTTDGILLVDSQGFIAGYNHQLLEMWNIPQSVIKSGNYAQVLEFAANHLKDPQEYIISVNQLLAYPGAEIDDLIELKDGRVFERYSQPQYIGGEIVGRVWSFRDISERFEAAATINHQASHDLLTNLPNRMQFNLRLLESLIKANQNNSKLAVCFLDLDRFKTINETLGHGIGDKLLKSVAHRLNKCLRSRDIVARWGGDEFTLLLSDINGVRDAARITEEILTALKPGFLIDNHLLHISASIGIAVYPNHGKDGETLIKNADAALNRAKLQGRNHYQIYNSAINSQASELLSLENSLHYALERNELRLYYQPQVDVTTGEICKFEALLRWEHPQYGLISPSKFIPIAEETGLIIPISEWVLRTACTQNKIWQNILGLPSVGVAVNLSARQFQQLNLVNTVRRILTETKLSPQYLELEITESAAMQNVEFSQEILTQLHDMGVSISIDDFGTGYCSFNYLKQFPIHCLKIDRSFVRDLTNDTNDAAIITAMIALAHGLNLSVVAEGVETEEQRNLLRILECELIQGNLFSPAVCAQQATELLLKSHSRLMNTSVLVA
ncbi:MAG: EAL domain-containing protein [Nostocales cyanobacterium 94392]|nr:EAL domain-containing protein [Nostocales cyanobacterium 94392]